MKHKFKARIYKTGINWCVDVPLRISRKMKADKGYIRVSGEINRFHFKKTLVPVKGSPYRLFVNLAMMKGGGTALGKMANFVIEQDGAKVIRDYPVPDLLMVQLRKKKLNTHFDNLTSSRKRDILKYLSYIKKEETLLKNIDKLTEQLGNDVKNVRIP